MVHLASQTALSRQVALKFSKMSGDDASGVAILLQEARAMGLVEHPNVVPVYLIGQNDAGRPVIVMKRIQGEPWSKWIDNPPEEDDIEFHLRTFMDVCQAVAYAPPKTSCTETLNQKTLCSVPSARCIYSIGSGFVFGR